jgi:hypothetical protein
VTTDDLQALAAEAFIYGFALVFDLGQVERFTRDGMSGVPPTPFNCFGHATALAGPESTFVSINNDTVYSIAQLDLSAGPVRLHVPDTGGRYYVLQFVDAWTNNFAYVGQRATGTGAGEFLLVGPGDAPRAGRDAPIIRCPTDVASIVGRWAVSGEDDLPAVEALQAGLVLTPSGTGRGLPQPAAGVPDDLRFFEQLRGWMQAFPPAERDRPYQDRFAPLGLLEATSPYVDAEPALAAALRAGAEQARGEMEHALRHAGGPAQNGWHLGYHAFDYNLDFFELGALDDPAWQIDAPPQQRYLARALAARGGLWGNHGYEAAYAQVYDDAGGAPLDGNGRYELRFATPPPVGAFWSVTMYDLPEFFLVANPIDRYSIGDRTPGLRVAEDGSVTIRMQREEPDEPDARANWLPTPDGPFRPLLRMYEPAASVLDGSYVLPPITKA